MTLYSEITDNVELLIIGFKDKPAQYFDHSWFFFYEIPITRHFLTSYPQPTPMQNFILVMRWITYCAMHSFLITPSVTTFMKQIIGSRYSYYRLTYNLLAIGSLIPVLLYTYFIRQTPFFIWDGYPLPIKYLLLATGMFTFISGARHYDMSTFLGLRRVREKVNHNLINASGELDSSGILGLSGTRFIQQSAR